MRAVAGAEIATYPLGPQIDRRHFRTEGRRAAQVGTQANQQEDFRLDRAHPWVDVSRLHRGLRFWISEFADDFLEIAEDLFCASHDEYWLPAPLSNHLLAGFNLGNIDLHRCTGGFRLGTGKP